MYDDKEERFKRVEGEKLLELLRQREDGLEPPLFEVGEIIEVHGVKLRLRKITAKDLIFRRVKKETP